MEKMEIENLLLAAGYSHVCGADEVGRGPLAGPVVCAAVIMPVDVQIPGIDDSKKLTKAKREALSFKIKKAAISYCIWEEDEKTIDKINILQATRLCMKEAIEHLALKPDFVITDGNMTLDIEMPQRHIIKGDAKSYTIASASILAKTYRDKKMEEIAKLYPGYGFEKHMGYPTKKHIEALKSLGLCPVHRLSFCKKWTGH